MAGRDGRGPQGMGPMTGRGLGNCTGNDGVGRGRTGGRGFGRGFRRNQAGFPNTAGPTDTLADELAQLRDQVQALTARIAGLSRKD